MTTLRNLGVIAFYGREDLVRTQCCCSQESSIPDVFLEPFSYRSIVSFLQTLILITRALTASACLTTLPAIYRRLPI
jgi:hypothetical protein